VDLGEISAFLIAASLDPGTTTLDTIISEDGIHVKTFGAAGGTIPQILPGHKRFSSSFAFEVHEGPTFIV
jgi:hypothetical protein